MIVTPVIVIPFRTHEEVFYASARLRRAVSAVVLSLVAACSLSAETPPSLRLTTFQSNITPPLGQPMFSCDPLHTVEEPLLAKGIVLEAAAERYVLCALDWCELCNGSYDAIRSKIAQAAGTDASHVALQTIHQHTAPMVDMDSQKLLAEAGFPHGIHIDPEVYADIEQRVVASVKQSIDRFEPFDRIGVGQAKVDRVASSRRPRDKDGTSALDSVPPVRTPSCASCPRARSIPS